MADSSTDAMPSITVPSPGISSPASTTTTSPLVSSAACLVVPSCIAATVSWRIDRSVSAWARPRPSANASAMLANTTVSHSQNEITNVYQAGSSPPSALPPNTWISQVTVVMAAPISTTNITGLRICTRGSSLIRLSISARRTMSGRNSETARRSEPGAEPRACDGREEVLTDISVPPERRFRARLSSSTLTSGSPEKPSPRPPVYVAIRRLTSASGRWRTAAMRCAWMWALATEMSGSIPDAEVLAASTGILAAVRPPG